LKLKYIPGLKIENVARIKCVKLISVQVLIILVLSKESTSFNNISVKQGKTDYNLD